MTQVPTITLNNGSQIPQLGFGVFMVPPEDTADVVAKAFEVGYRHIDTAALYGNEEGVGKAVRDSRIARDELFITTKLANRDQGPDTAQAAFDLSLERLGLDHVDLYLVHWPLPARDLYVDTWRVLEQIHASGRARAIGVSNFQPDHLRRLTKETDVVPAVNQIEVHPTFAQDDVRAVNAELGIATEVWAPIGKGGDELALPAVTKLAESHGKTPAQVVLRWHLQRGDIVFPKSVTPSRIEENFDVWDFELSPDEMAEISGLESGNRMGPDPDTFNP